MINKHIITSNDEVATILIYHHVEYVAFAKTNRHGGTNVNSCPSVELVVKVAKKIRELK